jgi:hypothetical protein
MTIHNGGCHCGRVRFQIEAPAHLQVNECNCSICSKAGYLHLILAKPQFNLLQGRESLTTYVFNTGTARHLFCLVCGVKSFYIPRSHPDGVSVNARCLDEGSVTGLSITAIDGRHWEQQYPQGRGSFD